MRVAGLFAGDAPIARHASALGQRPHGFYWTEGQGGLGWAVDAVPTLKNGSTIGIASPPAVLMPDGRIVKLGIADGERLQGFDLGWTAPAETVARPSVRWGLVGSAVSVPVARWIGDRLRAPGDRTLGVVNPFPDAGKCPRAALFDGNVRRAVVISADPLGIAPAPLTRFLDPAPAQELLSAKATLGFLKRTRRARLRFEPGFIEAVERHLLSMAGTVPAREPEPQLELLAA